MARDRETIHAASRDEAIERIYDLYPTATDIQIESRRNTEGHFSAWGHTFVVSVSYEEEEGEPLDYDDFGDLGEEEYGGEE